MRGRELTREVDGGMQHMSEHALIIGDDKRVDIDQAMALALVVGGNARAHGKDIANNRGREVLHAAAGVHPRPKDDVVAQGEVACAQHEARVDKVFTPIKHVGFADSQQILASLDLGHSKRCDTKGYAASKCCFVGRWTVRRRRAGLIVSEFVWW